ncbi:MAG TPA: UDP-N-acetylmuramoyl-L-alanine--D-glutamate ligase [Stellaceae bacterium]|nr:UDP-N-acetylmuramoyl-L-alanine--D-glutamate ligase [Stellaceae bacterium]
MIEVSRFRNESVAILGLARSGLAAAKALQKGGARVLAWDDAEKRRIEALETGVPLTDLTAADLRGVRALVLSPGIPHSFPVPHKVAARAKEAGIPIIGDIELLALSRREARYLGVTGTNGKSTTTALIGHILAQSGRRVAVGGNIGVPALALDALNADGTYVLEMSSYQLELCPSLIFDGAALLNITPDHLDRHGGMDGYVAAKERIFAGQNEHHFAVVGFDDAICRGIAAKLRRQRVIPISGAHEAPGGVSAADGWLVDDTEGAAQRILDLRTVERLPGRHNWQNAAAAFAAARALGLSATEAASGIRTFAGLAHRQETITVIDGVRYVNDSKATNAASTEKALACYERIHWIAGGQAKEGGITTLARYFPRIRKAYLIGAAAKDFAATLEGKVTSEQCGTLARALEAAHAAARAGETVLLSPACASFDQFTDFEARGDAFRRLVATLPGAHA